MHYIRENDNIIKIINIVNLYALSVKQADNLPNMEDI